jgi:tetratricopeptide (TPR) repeat protein
MTAETMEQAFQAFNRGELAVARQLCSEVLDKEPDYPPALTLVGLIAAKEFRFEEAVSWLERSANRERHPLTLLNLASCLWRVGRVEQGLSYVEELVSQYPDVADGYLMGANLLHGLRRFEQAKERALRALQLDPSSHMAEARLGCILSDLGYYDEAELHFQNVTRMKPKFVQCRLIRFGKLDWERVNPDMPPDPAPIPVVLHRTVEDVAYDAVVVACCDAQYLYKYGPVFVDSFVQNAARDKLLHLHVVDTDDRFDDFIHELALKFHPPNWIVTSERTPDRLASSPAARRTYYSCVRFLRFLEWLDEYSTPVICFDIDTIFKAPIDELLTDLARDDIGLIRREPPHSPWLDVVANIVFVRQTPAARRYLRAVQMFISNSMERGELFWHLDQITLYCILIMMNRFDHSPQVGWITDTMRTSILHVGSAYDFKLREESAGLYGN